MIRFLTLIFLALFLSYSKAQDPTAIVITGNQRTRTSVILREMRIDPTAPLTEQNVSDGLRRLRNTNLFSRVDSRWEENSEGQVLVVEVEERWTTIPIFKLSSGGGVNQVTLGVYDPNLGGQYTEAGAQYERLGDTDSGVIWFKKPSLFNSRTNLDFQLWNVNRLRTKYEQDIDDPRVKTGFLHTRRKLYLGLEQEVLPRFTGKVFYEFNDDSFSDRLTPPEVRSALASSSLPPATKVHFLGLGGSWGQVNHKNDIVEGNLLTAQYRYALVENPKIDDFWQIDLVGQYFKRLWGHTILAQRLMGGFTTTDVLQYWFYLGGLDRIRGFSDNRFAGRYFWLSNTELRLSIHHSSRWILQTPLFVDITSTAEVFSGLNEVSGASAGGGLRLMLPKVYRLVLRLDYAVPLKRTDSMNVSFGVQQFF